MAFIPIWRDRIVSLDYNDQQPYTDYEVRSGATVIYTGRAYNRPDNSGQFLLGPEIRVNDIVADYLRQTFVQTVPASFVVWSPGFAFHAALYAGGSQKSSDTFYLDYSYNYGREPVRDMMHDPVDFRLDYRQLFLFSCPGQGYDFDFVFTGGTAPETLTVQMEDDSNVAINLSSMRGAPARLDIQGMTFSIDRTGCGGRYVLHYVNAFGGWDALLMSGQPLKSRTFDRKRMATDYDNAVPLGRGTFDYLDIITPAWTLRTGLLTELQSERMHHLLGSTLVYLQDLTDGIFLPVVLTDTAADEVTANGNGRRPIQYSVRVELASERIRR